MPSFRDRAAWESTVGHHLAAVVGHVREGNSVYRRYACGCDQGVWPRLMAYMRSDLDLSAVLLDSTVALAYARTTGAPPKKATDLALVRSAAASAPRSIF